MTTGNGALQFIVSKGGGKRSAQVTVDGLIIAGWTGRDAAAMEAHIKELEALGVKRPASTPIFYRAAAALLTQGEFIEVVGSASSGEVEPVLVSGEDEIYLGVGSDHTDREVETVGITISKQLCAKPVSRELWPLAEVAGHWDALVIRSWATRGGVRTLYQQSSLAKMRTPEDLQHRYGGDNYRLPAGTVMYCGTVPVQGEIAPAEQFEIEIEDPILKRTIRHAYVSVELPIAG